MNPNTNHFFEALVNGRHIIHADNFTSLRRLGSKAANKDFNEMDFMSIKDYSVDPPEHYSMTRINKKSPDNTIIRGKWI